MKQRLMRFALSALLIPGCAAVILKTPGSSVERVIAAALLIFVLPGLAATSAFSPGLAGVGWLLLVPALSIAIAILDSGALYLAKVTLDLHSWTYSIAAVGLVLTLIGLLRPTITEPRLPRRRVGNVVPLLIGVVLACGLLAATTYATMKSVSDQEHADHYTQLWALPAGRGHTATIGVYNHEDAPRSYTLTITDGVRSRQTLTLSLPAGGRWVTRQPYAASARYLRATLTMYGNPLRTYRWVQLNFRSTRSSHPRPKPRASRGRSRRSITRSTRP